MLFGLVTALDGFLGGRERNSRGNERRIGQEEERRIVEQIRGAGKDYFDMREEKRVMRKRGGGGNK